VYQGFSLLTANWPVVNDPRVRAIAQRAGVTPAQVIFRFAIQVGMMPVTGTSSGEHMHQDLEAVGGFTLEQADVDLIESIAVRHRTNA